MSNRDNEYKLIVVEKPSVAQSIAKVLGVNEKKNGYFQGHGYIISWCVGHLVSLADASVYDEKFAKWRYEDLPILPKQWEFVISSGKEKQFQILKKLMNDKTVESLVCATDSGREGEVRPDRA